MTQPYSNDLTVLVNCLATTFGDEVGQAVQDKFDQVLALEAVDINRITGQIAQLNALLAANTTSDSVTAASILSQLHTIDGRLDNIEGSTAVANLTAVVAALTASLTAETASRVAGDENLQNEINAIRSTVEGLSQQLVALENGGSTTNNTCDCPAIMSQLAAQTTALANLQAYDAATAIQITSLQATVQGLHTSVLAAQAAADAAAATAQSALTAAAAAAAAAAKVASDLAALTALQTTRDHDNQEAHDTFITKVEIQNINCVAVGHSMRVAMRARMFDAGNPKRN